MRIPSPSSVAPTVSTRLGFLFLGAQTEVRATEEGSDVFSNEKALGTAGCSPHSKVGIGSSGGQAFLPVMASRIEDGSLSSICDTKIRPMTRLGRPVKERLVRPRRWTGRNACPPEVAFRWQPVSLPPEKCQFYEAKIPVNRYIVWAVRDPFVPQVFGQSQSSLKLLACPNKVQNCPV